MRHQVVLPAALLLGAAFAGGCKPAGESRTDTTAATTTASTTATVSPTARDTTLSAGAIGTRSEAQDHFDKSREAFAKKDLKTASTELHDAATFMRTRADSATGFARALSARSASELDSLSRVVTTDTKITTARLDHAFAHANRAEAERHYALATRAWAQHQAQRTGEELTMAIDHLERAAKDAGISLDKSSTDAMERARAVADSQLQGGTAPNGVDGALKEVELQLRQFGAKLENRKM